MKVWATTDRQASVMLLLWMSNTNCGFLITFTQKRRGRLRAGGRTVRRASAALGSPRQPSGRRGEAADLWPHHPPGSGLHGDHGFPRSRGDTPREPGRERGLLLLASPSPTVPGEGVHTHRLSRPWAPTVPGCSPPGLSACSRPGRLPMSLGNKTRKGSKRRSPATADPNPKGHLYCSHQLDYQQPLATCRCLNLNQKAKDSGSRLHQLCHIFLVTRGHVDGTNLELSIIPERSPGRS